MSKVTYFYGIHTVNIILNSFPESVVNIYIQNNLVKENNRIAQLANLANKYGLIINTWSKQKLDGLANNSAHQGIVVESKTSMVLKNYGEDELKNFYKQKLAKNDQHKFFILILDEIQDPQNFGACIRSSEALGVDFIISTQKNSAPITNAVCKASAGAALLTPIFQVTNLARTIRWLKEEGTWVYGTGMGENSESIEKLDFKNSVAIVMGAEGTGIRRLTAELCDGIFTIPMQGKTQSLNVSVATGICLYEVVRQRQNET